MPGYVVGPGNELLSDGTYDYTYDADGNCVRRTSIATSAVTEYTWDNRNRLVEVEDLASPGGPVTQAVDYLYDVENRWIGETVNQENGQPVQTTHFAYDGNQIVLQFQSNSPLPLGEGQGEGNQSQGAILTDRYVWGPAVDQLLSDEQLLPSPSGRGAGGEGSYSLTQPGNVLFALTDNQNTVRDLAQYNPQTGTTSVVDHREFNSYGQLESQTNPSVTCTISYTGRPFDTSTGLQNNLNRWTANCGWWLSEDPSAFEGGDTNLYRYCGNSPLNGADPSGLQFPIEVLPGHEDLFEPPPPAPPTIYGGLNVTNVLQQGLALVITKFNSLTDSQKSAICYQLLYLPTAAYAWDIPNLISDDPILKPSQGIWGAGASSGTVTVAGSVYWGAAVNYALYGELMRLCYGYCVDTGKPTSNNEALGVDDYSAQDFTLENAQSTARIYRSARTLTDGYGVDQQVAFVTDGWNLAGATGQWSAIKSVGIPNAVPCKISYTAVMRFRVGSRDSNLTTLGRILSLTQDPIRGIIDFTIPEPSTGLEQ